MAEFHAVHRKHASPEIREPNHGYFVTWATENGERKRISGNRTGEMLPCDARGVAGLRHGTRHFAFCRMCCVTTTPAPSGDPAG